MGSLNLKARPSINLDPEQEGWGRRVAKVLNNVLSGKLNNTGTAILSAGAASVTISDARCGPESVIFPMGTGPTPIGHYSIQTRTDGAFTITRASATATCTIAYTVIG